MESAYSHRQAARILKISPARLRYWERTALVRPSLVRDSRPAFGFRDLATLRGVLALLRRGVPLGRIRKSAAVVRECIPEVDQPLGALRVWLDGSRRMVVQRGASLLEPDGQVVFDFDGSVRGACQPASLPEPPRNSSASAPGTALHWFERGCELDAEPATSAEAIEAYRKALEADPHFADAHCNLGTAHYNRDRRDAARACFERALELEPGHLEANFNLASMLEEDGCGEAAVRHYRRVLRADPLYADAHVNLALLYEKLGVGHQAREHWRRYLQIEPTGAWADFARRHLRGTR